MTVEPSRSRATDPLVKGLLAGKVCLVTGASRGIGKAIAEAFAAEGARLGMCAVQAVPETAPAARSRYAALCDVCDAAEVDAFFTECALRLGPPDVLVLNAGVFESGPLESFTEAQWDRVLDVNLKAAFLCSRAVWPSLQRRRAGRVIAVGSISGTLGTPEACAYNASKWGLTGFMKSLAEEGRSHGIFCATVLPGSVDTDMLKKTPYPPQLKPEDVASVVTFLASSAPFAMTGAAVEAFG